MCVWHIHRQGDRFWTSIDWSYFILIVILARGHGSGNVERQCSSSSDVSSGVTAGGRVPLADICRFRLLWFLCCVVHGPLRHCTLPGVGRRVGWPWLEGTCMHGWLLCECWAHLPLGSWPLWQACHVLPLPVVWLVPHSGVCA